MEIGDHVIYVDKTRKHRPALVTAIWEQSSGPPSLNVVMVSNDEARRDQYGRQVEHESSIPHQTGQPAPGNYWLAIADLEP